MSGVSKADIDFKFGCEFEGSVKFPSSTDRSGATSGLVDVGGGSGQFLSTLVQASPLAGESGANVILPRIPRLRSLCSTSPTMASSNPVTKFEDSPQESRTFARQHELPKLPVPPLEDTCKRYLRALEGLQDSRDHEETKRAVEDFLRNDGPRMQEKLIDWAKDKARCVVAAGHRRRGGLIRRI